MNSPSERCACSAASGAFEDKAQVSLEIENEKLRLQSVLILALLCQLTQK
jgi:hypothetical protein